MHSVYSLVCVTVHVRFSTKMGEECPGKTKEMMMPRDNLNDTKQ